MALVAGVVIVNDIAVEPVFVINGVNPMFFVCDVGEVEILGRNDFLVGVHHCYVYLLGSHF